MQLLVIILLVTHRKYYKAIVEDLFISERQSIKQLPNFRDLYYALIRMTPDRAKAILTNLNRIN